MEPRKATHEGLRRHNRRMLLHALYSRQAESRAALAQITGLTKPSVSNLVAELIADGLVSERGHGQASESGGKRPRLLRFENRSRQLIGVSVDHLQITAVLTDLAGRPSAHHRVELDSSRPLELLRGVVDGLVAQLDAPLMCIAVGLPGEVDWAGGMVKRSAATGWRNLQVAAPLADRYRVPVHVANGTELTALAQFAFADGSGKGTSRLVTLLVEQGVELGVTLEDGAVHYGADLGHLRVEAGWSECRPLVELLRDDEILARAAEMTGGGPGDMSTLDFLALRYAALQGEQWAAQAVTRVAQLLTPVVAWAVSLLAPQQLTLAGPVTDLGEELLTELRARLDAYLPAEMLAETGIALAHSRLTGALGAVALALQQELGTV